MVRCIGGRRQATDTITEFSATVASSIGQIELFLTMHRQIILHFGSGIDLESKEYKNVF